MTIALAVRVHDGIVLATDSAGTIFGPPLPTGTSQVFNIYNNANKLFNLVKGQPIGGMTWGSGSIGTASISTHIKDLRLRMSTPGPSHLDPKAYTVEDVAKRVRDFFDEQVQAVPNINLDGGFLVAGYSVGGAMAESWLINLRGRTIESPVQQQPSSDGYAVWGGQPEAVCRLLLGIPSALPEALKAKGVPDQEIGAWLQEIQKRTTVGLIQPAMPIQDAIDLAEFLVQTAIQFTRFSPGAQTVGGPIDVASITKHEGFKWIKRKYYYSRKLNPTE